jgi:DNA processing protein
MEASDLERPLASVGGRMVFPEDREYPVELGDLADPPLALFVRGRSLATLVRRVAIVGARRSTPMGLEVARDIGRGIAGAGGCVVSGAARGIDTAAHEGALEAGGATIAVLGSGIDVPYPARNARLLQRVADSGAVVTEYPPGVPAQAFRFPARNRIVAALADAVVIVEGATGSGSLITADHALDLGRQVFAVPGPVTSPLSEVPLALIRDGATLVRGARDVIEDLGWTVSPSLPDAMVEPAGGVDGGGGAVADALPGSPPALGQHERAVLDAVGGRTLPEHVAGELGWPMERVMAALLQLELRGLVRSVGGRFERRVSDGR